ncbi:MAG: nucleotidyltransferase domain-containing protein [Chitinivibrionales bacterium]|nr:nucleotidyltransferase domain-containing protein [Chitinivibrionales bacterium]
MDKTIQELIQAFKKLLQNEFGDQLSQVILFGSFVTGRATPSSDIDIAVILNCATDWHIKQTVYDLAYEAESNTGRLLNVIVFSRLEYDTRAIESLLLIENIKEQGVLV